MDIRSLTEEVSEERQKMVACAACKYLRRKCTQECIFAPHFPPHSLQKFECVHKVYGASNVAKLLNDLPFDQRDDAVVSLVYEAEARLRDPIYGSAGPISILQHRLTQLQHELENSRKELATYVGPQAMLPIFQPQQPYSMFPPLQSKRSSSSSASVLPQHHQNLVPMMTVPNGQSYQQQQQQQQFFEAHQLAAVDAVAREQQNEMFRAYREGRSPHHQNQGQVEILRCNNGFDSVPDGSVMVAGFNQVSSEGTAVTELSLGGNFADTPSTNNSYYTDQQLHQHHEAQLFIPTQSFQPLTLQTQETQTNSKSEEGHWFTYLNNE